MKTAISIVALISLVAAGCSSSTADTAGNGKNLGTTNDPSNQASSTGAIGDPCIPEDEAHPNFSGYSETEVNIESESPSCSSGICLVNGFRGRISCPEGQSDPAHPSCTTTGSDPVPVAVAVPAQLESRPAEDAAYCSCRCDGPAGTGPFCACADGFECTKLVDAYGTAGGAQLAGSYCIKAGTGSPTL
jgi:hypothetical protein